MANRRKWQQQRDEEGEQQAVANGDRPHLHMGQVRLLRVLYQACGWLDRATLCERAGISATSGTFTAAMHGRTAGSVKARAGLVPAGLVEKESQDIEGVWVLCYRITEHGKDVLRGMGLDHGELPPPRDAAQHTNTRYKRSS